jgi:hypothetical protein
MTRILFSAIFYLVFTRDAEAQKITFTLNTKDQSAFGYNSLMYLQLFNAKGQRIQEEIDVEPSHGFEVDFSQVEYFLMTEEKTQRTLKISLRKSPDGNHEILYHEVKASQPTIWQAVPTPAPIKN